jgi:hypothetical protein
MPERVDLGVRLPDMPQRETVSTHIIVTHQIPLIGRTLVALTGEARSEDPKDAKIILKFAQSSYGPARARWQWVRKDRKDEALGGRPVDSTTGKVIEGTGWEGRLLGCGESTHDRVKLLAATGLRVRKMAAVGIGTQNINRSFEMLRTGGGIDWSLLLELENYFKITNAILDAQNDLDKVNQFRRSTEIIVKKLPEEAGHSLCLRGDSVLQTEPIPCRQEATSVVQVDLSDAERTGIAFLSDLGKIGLPVYRAVLDIMRTPLGFVRD